MRLIPTQTEIDNATREHNVGNLTAEQCQSTYAELSGKFEKAFGELTEGDSVNWSNVKDFQGKRDDKEQGMRLLNAHRVSVMNHKRELDEVARVKNGLERDQALDALNDMSNREGAKATNIVVDERAVQGEVRNLVRMIADKAGIETGDIKNTAILNAVMDQRNGRGVQDVGLKLGDIMNVLGTGNVGLPVFSQRSPLVVETPFPPSVIDIIPRINVTSDSYEHRRQTTGVLLQEGSAGTPSAKATAVGATAAGASGKEIQPDWETVTTTIRKLLAYVPLTEEQMKDAGTDQYATMELVRELRNSADREVLIGPGGNSRMAGLFGVANTFTTKVQPAAAANNPSFGWISISEAMATIMKDVWSPVDFIIMHPLDWHSYITATDDENRPLVLDKDERKDKTILGVPVLESVNMTQDASQGTVFVGAFRMNSNILDRQQVSVARTDAHDENFIKDVVVVKAGVRMAVLKKRNNAFYSITAFSGKKSV